MSDKSEEIKKRFVMNLVTRGYHQDGFYLNLGDPYLLRHEVEMQKTANQLLELIAERISYQTKKSIENLKRSLDDLGQD